MKRFLATLSALVLMLCFAGSLYADPINLLANPGFEDDLASWTTDGATIRTGDPAPHSGSKYLMGGTQKNVYTYQVVSLVEAGFDATDIDSGGLAVTYGGWQNGLERQTDRGKIEIVFLDENLVELGIYDLGWQWPSGWTEYKDTIPLLSGTRYIKYGFYGEKHQTNENDAYLDDAFLEVNGVPIPSTVVLLGIGLVGLVAFRRQSKN